MEVPLWWIVEFPEWTEGSPVKATLWSPQPGWVGISGHQPAPTVFTAGYKGQSMVHWRANNMWMIMNNRHNLWKQDKFRLHWGQGLERSSVDRCPSWMQPASHNRLQGQSWGPEWFAFFLQCGSVSRTSSERVVAKMDCQVCMDWNQELLFRGSAHDDAMSQSFTVKANSASSAFFISWAI